jgi:type I restriction enzyme S subunit
VPIKRFARIMSGKAPPEEEPGSSVTFPVFGSNGQIGTTHRYNSSSPTLIVGRVGASGALHLTKGPTWISDNALIVDASPRSVDLRFLHFALSTVDFEPLISTTAQPLLTGSSLSRVMVPRPPLDVQRAIADFLDRKTAAIDALIDKKERLLALLQEKRQALITQAVTKGLDPNVPMKDSGIEWLGEIPAHWEVVPIKHLARLQTGTTPPTAEDRYYENGSVPWFGPSSVGDGLFVGAPVKHLNLSAVLDGRARLIPALSTLVTCIGATLGRSGLLESEGTANQQITSLSFDPCHGDPLFMALSIKRLEPVLRERAQYTTLPIVNQSELGTYPLAVPPILEQHAIACAAKNELGRVDSLELTTRRSIARLSEYRQTLITAAVTGQLDVTGEQA